MAQDDLTLTIRVHDPLEKESSEKSATWAVRKVARADLAMPLDQFFEKYVKPAFSELFHWKPKA